MQDVLVKSVRTFYKNDPLTCIGVVVGGVATFGTGMYCTAFDVKEHYQTDKDFENYVFCKATVAGIVGLGWFVTAPGYVLLKTGVKFGAALRKMQSI